MREFLVACSRTFGGNVYVELNPVGYDATKHTKYGVEGTCDAKGYVWRDGEWAIPFQCEIKTGDADLEPHQRKWRDKCQNLAVLHIVLTCTEPSEKSRVIAAAMNVLRLAQDGKINDRSQSFRIE